MDVHLFDRKVRFPQDFGGNGDFVDATEVVLIPRDEVIIPFLHLNRNIRCVNQEEEIGF